MTSTRRRIRKAPDQAPQKPNECRKCGTEFAWSRDLYNHILCAHPEELRREGSTVLGVPRSLVTAGRGEGTYIPRIIEPAPITRVIWPCACCRIDFHRDLLDDQQLCRHCDGSDKCNHDLHKKRV